MYTHYSHYSQLKFNMWLILFGFCVSGLASQRFISVREQQLTGDDPTLAQELARRMTLPPPRPPPDLDYQNPALLNLEPPEPVDNTTGVAGKDSRKRFWGDYVLQTQERQVFDKIAQLMEQAIYSTQYRIKEADYIVRKYQKDPRFRLAYVFCKLEDWRHDAFVYYSYQTNHTRHNPYYWQVRRHLRYYQHVLARQVDVTYTVEYAAVLYHEVLHMLGQDSKDKDIDVATTVIDPQFTNG